MKGMGGVILEREAEGRALKGKRSGELKQKRKVKGTEKK